MKIYAGNKSLLYDNKKRAASHDSVLSLLNEFIMLLQEWTALFVRLYPALLFQTHV